MFDADKFSRLVATTESMVDELLEEAIDGTNSDQDIEVALTMAYLRIRREVQSARLRAIVRAEVRWAMWPPGTDFWPAVAA